MKSLKHVLTRKSIPINRSLATKILFKSVKVWFYLSSMPITYYDEETVKEVIKLWKLGWGYRRIGNAVGMSKDATMRIWKAYTEGRIRVREDGVIELIYKPAGVIKYQFEGIWNPRTHSFIKPPEPRPTPVKYELAPMPQMVSDIPKVPRESGQKVFEVRIPKARFDFFTNTLLSLHEAFNTIIPLRLLPPLPPPAPLIPPNKAFQELFYAKISCPGCGENVYVKPFEWSGVKRSVLCGNCGVLIQVEFTD